MSIWNKDDKAKSNESPKTDTQQERIKNLSGFASLDDVAKKAEEITFSAPVTRKRAQTKRDIENQQQLEKEAKIKQAMETLGRFYSKELTAIPYDIWAYVWDDPELKLSEEEHTKLTEALFLTIQGFNLDLSSPWKALLGFSLFNVSFIGKRVKKIQAHKQTLKETEGEINLESKPN